MLQAKAMKISFKVIVCWATVHASLSAINEREPVYVNCSSVPVNHIVHLKESITINCKYPKEENNIKYFCKKYENFNCTNVISSYNSNKARSQRSSLTVDEQHGVFTVLLSSLTVEDAGFYWCALRKPDHEVTCLSRHHLRVLNTEENKMSMGVSKQATVIRCNYSESQRDSEKYLCKGEKPSNCEQLIGTSDERYVSSGRFHLNDNKRLKHFTVSIKHLRKNDSGTYWCVSGGSEDTEVTKVLFSVDKKDVKRKETHPNTTAGKPTEGEKDNDKKAAFGVIAGILVSGTLSLAAVSGLIVYYQKRPMERGGSSEPCSDDPHNTEGNNEDHLYEEVALQDQQGSAVMTVYSTACPPSDDMIFYTTVNFLKDTNTLPEDTSSSAFFSSVHGAAHPAETAVYSTVKNPGEL